MQRDLQQVNRCLSFLSFPALSADLEPRTKCFAGFDCIQTKFIAKAAHAKRMGEEDNKRASPAGDGLAALLASAPALSSGTDGRGAGFDGVAGPPPSEDLELCSHIPHSRFKHSRSCHAWRHMSQFESCCIQMFSTEVQQCDRQRNIHGRDMTGNQGLS